MTKKKRFFDFVKASESKGEIFIYGDIVPDGYEWGEDTSASVFRDELKQFENMDQIDIRINSGGGDVFTAVAIYNMIKRTKAKTVAHIDGLAASAASVIPMACDEIIMPENAIMMVHNAWSFVIGNHIEMRKFADDLERINETTVKQAYLSRNPELEESVVTDLMDKETWLNASQAMELGLITSIGETVQTAASITSEQIARYKNAPAALLKPDKDNPSNEQEDRLNALETKITQLLAALEESKEEEPEPEPKKPEEEPAKPTHSKLAKLFTL